MPKPKLKGDDEDLVYGFDWSEWLASTGDTIQTSTWVVPTDLTASAEQNTTTLTTVKLAGGVVGETYIVTNIIVTANSLETAERSFKLRITEAKYS